MPTSLRRLALTAAFVSCAAAGFTRADARGSQAHASRLTLSEQVLQPIPLRNLYALTEQLRLHPPRPIAKVVRTTSPNYPVGHTDSFWILSEDHNNYFKVHATVVAETPHLYMYIQNGRKYDLAKARQSADFFEHHIYPTDHRYYGSEWTPGVDGDPHITVLVADLRSSSAEGFFSAEDEYTRAVNPYSNQREMFYMNSIYIEPGQTEFNDVLSHEFQHMIHWHVHPHDNGWLNEGMSVLAERLNGFTGLADAYRGEFAALPQTQLTSWAENGPTALSHYGAAYLFLSYILTHYGAGFIKAMISDAHLTDMALVDAVLKERHVPLSADELFSRWVVANALDDSHVAGGIYAYQNLPHPVNLPKPRQAPFQDNGKLNPYAAQYEAIDGLAGAKPFTLTFSAPDSIPLVGVKGGTPFWWSNRGDMSDTRLERTVDLSHVKHATLTFDAWYDIEKDYDYGYVEASRDGGKTWTPLKATTSTTANPYGASYGQAFTAQSKGWRSETVDLTPYAGHAIELRFEVITDEIFNGQGLVVRNLSIPQIGFHDDLSGWTAQGFVPVTSNSLPAAWHIRLIEYTSSGIHVRSLPQSAGSSGGYTASLHIDPARTGLQKLVIAMFYTAPKTTLTLPWTLTASNG